MARIPLVCIDCASSQFFFDLFSHPFLAIPFKDPEMLAVECKTDDDCPKGVAVVAGNGKIMFISKYVDKDEEKKSVYPTRHFLGKCVVNTLQFLELKNVMIEHDNNVFMKPWNVVDAKTFDAFRW